MRVLYCHPIRAPGNKACVAFVDVELNEHVKLNRLRLIRQPDGAYYIFAPQVGQTKSATFSRPLAERLTALAVEALSACTQEASE